MCLLKEADIKSDKAVKAELFHIYVSFPFMAENEAAPHLFLSLWIGTALACCDWTLKMEFPAFIAVLIKLLTRLRQCQYLVGCICFYVVLKSWTWAQPFVLSKTLLNCLLPHGKYAEIASVLFCRCQVLTINSCLLKNGPIFAPNGTHFVLKYFQTLTTYFTSKWTCSSWKIIHFCWETSLLFYGNCARVNSHYCGNSHFQMCNEISFHTCNTHNFLILFWTVLTPLTKCSFVSSESYINKTCSIRERSKQELYVPVFSDSSLMIAYYEL